MPAAIDSLSVRANGVEFEVLSCGDGPLALCFHGFPDSAHTWRHLLSALADAGYRAAAPFQRGYAPTGVPPTVSTNRARSPWTPSRSTRRSTAGATRS